MVMLGPAQLLNMLPNPMLIIYSSAKIEFYLLLIGFVGPVTPSAVWYTS